MGNAVTKYGHYNPWLFIGTAMLAISGGIFSTFKVHTGDPLINGIQVLGGLGTACVIQMVCLLPEFFHEHLQRLTHCSRSSLLCPFSLKTTSQLGHRSPSSSNFSAAQYSWPSAKTSSSLVWYLPYTHMPLRSMPRLWLLLAQKD